jgi:histidine triad (HIT) family protein
MKSDCVFCGIVAGTVPSSKVYEDDQVIVINDISPKAKVHQLIIPKRHIDSVANIEDRHEPLMGHMIMVAKTMAEEAGLKGYKLLLNVNKEGGQSGLSYPHASFGWRTSYSYRRVLNFSHDEKPSGNQVAFRAVRARHLNERGASGILSFQIPHSVRFFSGFWSSNALFCVSPDSS